MDDWKKMEVKEVKAAGVPQHEYVAIKYCSGGTGKFLGDLVGRAIIPAAAAYAAHKLGVPHEYLMLAPGLLLIPPIFKAGRVLGSLCGRIGAYIGKKLPYDVIHGNVTHHVKGMNLEKEMEKVGSEFTEAGYDFKYRRIEDYVTHPD